MADSLVSRFGCYTIIWDTTSKRAAVTRMIGRAGTARILDEVEKCDIVCANCHRLRTLERRTAASARE